MPTPKTQNQHETQDQLETRGEAATGDPAQTREQAETTRRAETAGQAERPEGARRQHAIAPHLTTADPAAAIAFYERAFGARMIEPTLRMGGAIIHATLLIGDSVVMLGPSGPHGQAPSELGGTTVKLSLLVSDVAAAWATATDAGAEVAIPLDDQFYGHRSGRLRDPFGHEWILSQVVEDLSEAEMQARLDAMNG